jgi:hypothetical protein
MFNGGDKVVLTDIMNSKVATLIGKGATGVVTHKSMSGKVIVVKWDHLVADHEYNKISWMADRFKLWEAPSEPEKPKNKYKEGDLCVINDKYPHTHRHGVVVRLISISVIGWKVEPLTKPKVDDYVPTYGWGEQWLDPFILKPGQRVKFVGTKHTPSHYVGKLGSLKQKHLHNNWWLVDVDDCGTWYEATDKLEPIFDEPLPTCEPINPTPVVEEKPKNFWTFNPDTGVVKRDVEKPAKVKLVEEEEEIDDCVNPQF